jgi:hypothetical protein
MNIPGLCIWGDARAKAVNFEAQRSWFLALAAGAVVCVLQIKALRAERHRLVNFKSSDAKRGIRKHGQDVNTVALDSQLWAQQRKLVTNLVDLVLPGNVMGWIPASPGLVSLATLFTTLLSGYDVWKKVVRN